MGINEEYFDDQMMKQIENENKLEELLEIIDSEITKVNQNIFNWAESQSGANNSTYKFYEGCISGAKYQLTLLYSIKSHIKK